MIKVERFTWGFLETHTYLVEEGNHVLVIDPTDREEVLAKCCSAASVTVLLTHEHFDHVSGLNKLREMRASSLPAFSGKEENCSIAISDSTNYSCLVITGEICSERIQDAKANMSVYADVLAEIAEKPLTEPLLPFTCRAADITFKEHYAFRWLGHMVEMFASPGHSLGCCCILVDDVLFVGDTVLENNLMAQFPGSSKKLYRSATVPLLEKLLVGKCKCQAEFDGGKLAEELRLGGTRSEQLQPEALLVRNRVARVYPGHGDVMSPEVALGLARSV